MGYFDGLGLAHYGGLVLTVVHGTFGEVQVSFDAAMGDRPRAFLCRASLISHSSPHCGEGVTVDIPATIAGIL